VKALVTGAAGFIGSFLAKALLEKGHDVRGLLMRHENADDLEKLGMDIFRGDLTDPDTLKGVTGNTDVVFHLATRTLDWGTFRQFKTIMIDGTSNLLKESGGKISRFVYFSSIAALGLHEKLSGLDESAERKRCGIPYCDTKIDAENLVKKYCTQNKIDFTIIRPANVIGPGSVWVRDILDAFRRGPVPLINKGQAPGAFVYVDNLIEGAILAGESAKATGKTYHFRDDYPITWGEYLKILGGWIDKKPSVSLPFGLAWSLGSILETLLTPFGMRPPITRLAAGVMGLDNNVDSTLARKELGWKSRITQEDAMKRIETWVRDIYSP
jgi:nucleoside-diphosphate-sugar epimerase